MDPRPIYLDYQATTPVDPRVREAMLPFLKDEFGNPHSTNHAYGWEASDAVKAARAQVAHLINADDNEIVFTSGATESCNIALRGVARASDEKRNRIITVVTEHPAVLETVKDLGQSGYETVILPVGSDGLLDPANLEQELDERTLFVSVMAVNNEIGVNPTPGPDLQPVPVCGRAVPHRRNTGRRSHGDRCRCLRRRSPQLLRPQSLRSEGNRNPVRAIRRAHQADHHRRGAGTQASSRHRANAARRRLWGSMPLGWPARDPRQAAHVRPHEASRSRPAKSLPGPPRVRTPRTTNCGEPQCRLSWVRRRQYRPRRRQQDRSLDRICLRIGDGGTIQGAARARSRSGNRRDRDPHQPGTIHDRPACRGCDCGLLRSSLHRQ